jgi:hypothetical protein
MADMDDSVFNYIILITDDHEEGPWNNLSEPQKDEVLQKWGGFTLDREVDGIDYQFQIEELEENQPLERAAAVPHNLLDTHERLRQKLDGAYDLLVQEQLDNPPNQGAVDMEIDGGGKIRKSKRRKSKRRKSKKRKSKRRKSKRRKSKRR